MRGKGKLGRNIGKEIRTMIQLEVTEHEHDKTIGEEYVS